MKSSKIDFIFYASVLFILYFLLSTIFYYVSIFQGTGGATAKFFGGGDDGSFYWEQAINVAKGEEWIKTSIHSWIIGNVMGVLNVYDPFIIRFYNFIGFILLFTMSIKVLKLVKKENSVESINNYNAYTYLIIVYLLYSSFLINLNFSVLRDVWVYLFYLSAVFFSNKFLNEEKNKLLNFLVLVIILFMLNEFRSYAFVSFFMSTALILVLMKTPKKIWKTVLFSLLFFFGIYYSLFINLQLPILNMSLNDALAYRLSSIEMYAGGSQMNITLNQNNYFLFLWNYFHSYLGNFIGPLPWTINSANLLVIFVVESVPMILILIYLWKHKNRINDYHRYLLIHAFIWISFIAISNDNVGTATRLRPISWILILIVFISVYTSKKGVSKENDKDPLLPK